MFWKIYSHYNLSAWTARFVCYISMCVFLFSRKIQREEWLKKKLERQEGNKRPKVIELHEGSGRKGSQAADKRQKLAKWVHINGFTHICFSNLTIIGSDNGLSLSQRQAIIWTNAGILLIGPLRTNFNKISSKIQTFSFKKICLNVSCAKWWPFCLSLNVLI